MAKVEEIKACQNWGISLFREALGPSKDDSYIMTWPMGDIRSVLSPLLPPDVIDRVFSLKYQWETLPDSDIGLMLKAGAANFLMPNS